MQMRLRLGALVVANVLCASLLAQQEEATPDECYTFAERAPSTSASLGVTDRENAVRIRTAPVGSSGEYSRMFPIQVPPGRAGMTPSLALTYQSGAFRRDSGFGTGWSFGPSHVRRSVINGFPILKRVNGSLRYDDTMAVFESSVGQMVPAPDGPSGAAGQMWMAMREQAPTRFEFQANAAGGMWIEHDPSGRKRYYGSDLQSQRAQLVNELGTHTWMLLRDVDPNGNSIEYSYHNIEEQDRAYLRAPQRLPILKHVRWGGNDRLGIQHCFDLHLEITPRDGELNLAEGGTVLRDRCARMKILGPNNMGIWAYELQYVLSGDSGRSLLAEVRRIAPSEEARRTSFSYSVGLRSGPRFGNPEDLFPTASMHPVYCEVQSPFIQPGWYQNYNVAMDPPEKRSGHRFSDFDGDGVLDVIYHPAGLGAPAATIHENRSLLGTNSAPPTGWDQSALNSGIPWFEGIPLYDFLTELTDVDGDADADAIAFPMAITGGGGGGGGDGLADEDVSDLCCSDSFWNMCGDIDPLPWDEARSQRSGGGPGPWERGDRIRPPTSALGSDERSPRTVTTPVADDRGVRQIERGPRPEQPSDTRTNDGLGEPRGGSDRPDPLGPDSGNPGRDTDLYGEWCGTNPFGPRPDPGTEEEVPGLNCLRYVEACIETQSPCTDLVDTPSFPGQSPTLSESFCLSWLDVTDMPVSIYTNSSRSEAVSLFPQQALRWWPAHVGQRIDFESRGVTSEDLGNITPSQHLYRVETRSDFYAPCTDVNADGRSDLVLLKYMNTPNDRPAAYKFVPRAYLSMGNEFQLDLDPAVGGLVCDSLLDQPYPESRSEFTLSLIDILSGGRPKPCVGDPSSQVCNFAYPYPPRFNFNSFFLDVNADRLPDLVVAQRPQEITERRGMRARTHDALAAVGSWLGLSMTDFVADRLPHDKAHKRDLAIYAALKSTDLRAKDIAGALRCKAQQVEAASKRAEKIVLADSVSARFARRLGEWFEEHLSIDSVVGRRVVDGHTVFLNRGYRWEHVSGIGESWSSSLSYDSTDVDEDPFIRLANRNRVGLNDEDILQVDPSLWWDGSNLNVPVSSRAMTIVDLNADGRQDILFAYKIGQGSSTHTFPLVRVFLNTERGFQRSPVWESSIPTSFMISLEWRALAEGKQSALADLGRVVDVDSDGLVDLVSPGRVVFVQGSPTPTVMRPAQWQRNLGSIPDLLVEVREHSGSWERVEYAAAASRASRRTGLVDSSGVLSPGQMVVSRLESAAGPESSAIPHPVSTIAFTYGRFVRDDFSAEAIGFDRVIASFTNRTPAGAQQTLDVTTEYDVWPYVEGVSVRHPFKGKVLRVTANAGAGSTRTEVARYSVEAHGLHAARVRPIASYFSECAGGTCLWTGTELRDFDSMGYPMVHCSGPVSGEGASVTSDERTELHLVYEHRSDARWQLGLCTEEELFGPTESDSGAPLPNALLRHARCTFDDRGRLATRTRVGITDPAFVAAGLPPDDITSWEYSESGNLNESRTNRFASGLGTIVTEYDERELHPKRRTVVLTTYQGSAANGVQQLREEYGHDLRTGQLDSRIDFNGNRFVTVRDSFGRAVKETGPDGTALAEHHYQDAYPAHTKSIIRTAANQSFVRQSWSDGAGRELSTVDSANGVGHLQRTYFTYDSWGRERDSYLPRAVSSSALPVPPSISPHQSLAFDSFDRITKRERADGVTKSFVYAPSQITEIDPLQNRILRSFNWRDELVSVARIDSSGTPVASHRFHRDGAGAILRVVDADSAVRHLVHDAAGRPTRVCLPYRPGAQPRWFNFAYGLDDQILRVDTPGGNRVDALRDELGRIIQYTATDSAGSSAAQFFGYDQPAQQGLGRLTSLADDTGKTTIQYDLFGRRGELSFEPSDAIRADAELASSAFVAQFEYERRGHLRRARYRLGSLPTIDYTYERDPFGRPLLLKVKDPEGTRTVVSDLSHDALNRLTRAQFLNGTEASWTYAANSMRLDRIAYYSPTAPQSAMSVDYSYDDNDNIRAESRSGPGTAITLKQHGYDALDRLTSSSIIVNTGAAQEAFAYSPAGNIQTAAGAQYSYGIDALAQAVTGVALPDGLSRSLEYDLDGRLVTDTLSESSAGTPASAPTIRTLKYSPLGLPQTISTQSVDAGGSAIPISRTRILTGQNGRSVYRSTVNFESGENRRVLAFTDNVEIRPDDGVAVIRVPVGGSVMLEQAWNLDKSGRNPDHSGFVYADVRGSTLATSSVEDPAPLIERDAEYDAWGRTVQTSARPPPTHAFLGFEPDPDTGYYAFGARLYDPTLRRFLSPDPFVFDTPGIDTEHGQDLNLYAYARNNPVTFSDRTGEWAEAVAVEGPSLAIGIHAITQWDEITPTSHKVLDALGVLGDSVAVALPGVPGGFGFAVKAFKAGDKALDLVENVGKADKATEAAATLAKNKAKGDAFENTVEAKLKASQSDVAKQVTVETKGGTRTRVDFVSRDPETGAIKLTEAKSSATAPLTKNQKKAFPEIETSGGTVVGQGKPGVPGGTVIPPTKVDVVRPKDLKKD